MLRRQGATTYQVAGVAAGNAEQAVSGLEEMEEKPEETHQVLCICW